MFPRWCVNFPCLELSHLSLPHHVPNSMPLLAHHVLFLSIVSVFRLCSIFDVDRLHPIYPFHFSHFSHNPDFQSISAIILQIWLWSFLISLAHACCCSFWFSFLCSTLLTVSPCSLTLLFNLVPFREVLDVSFSRPSPTFQTSLRQGRCLSSSRR